MIELRSDLMREKCLEANLHIIVLRLPFFLMRKKIWMKPIGIETRKWIDTSKNTKKESSSFCFTVHNKSTQASIAVFTRSDSIDTFEI